MSAMEKVRNAKFKIGQVVKHRVYPFRGVIFDIDPQFNNTEEWWAGNPGGDPSAQGPAVLSSVRRKFGDRIHRLCVGTESSSRYLRRANPPSGRGRSFRAGRKRGIQAASQPNVLRPLGYKRQQRGHEPRLYVGSLKVLYFFCPGAGAAGAAGA